MEERLPGPQLAQIALLTYETREVELPILANVNCNILNRPAQLSEQLLLGFLEIATLLDADDLALFVDKHCRIVEVFKFIQLLAMDKGADKDLVLAGHFWDLSVTPQGALPLSTQGIFGGLWSPGLSEAICS